MLYSRNNYNIGVRSRRQFLVNELITCAASRAGLRLVDGLIRPEKLLVATASLKNGNGLFNVNYERIDRVLINLNEPALLCCEGEDVCAGSVPEHADLIYVKDVGVEGGNEAKTKQMARYLTYNNASEVLDSVYRASSLAENCLHRLVDSLAERSVLEECKAQLEELEVNGVFLFPFVPFASCADLELRLSKIDANFVQNITITLSNLGALIFVLQQFAVLSNRKEFEGVFKEILRNFRTLCWKQVPKEALLVLAVVVFRYAQKSRHYNAALYGDNVSYALGFFVYLCGLVGRRGEK